MKSNDLFLYGGIAVLAYLFLKPKTVAPGVYQVAPVQTYLPPIPQQQNNNNLSNTLLTAAAGLAPVVSKLFAPKPPVYTAPLQTAEVYADNSTPQYSLPTQLPFSEKVAYAPSPMIALEQMYESDAYPGNSLSGLDHETAACIGEY